MTPKVAWTLTLCAPPLITYHTSQHNTTTNTRFGVCFPWCVWMRAPVVCFQATLLCIYRHHRAHTRIYRHHLWALRRLPVKCLQRTHWWWYESDTHATVWWSYHGTVKTREQRSAHGWISREKKDRCCDLVSDLPGVFRYSFFFVCCALFVFVLVSLYAVACIASIYSIMRGV